MNTKINRLWKSGFVGVAAIFIVVTLAWNRRSHDTSICCPVEFALAGSPSNVNTNQPAEFVAVRPTPSSEGILNPSQNLDMSPPWEIGYGQEFWRSRAASRQNRVAGTNHSAVALPASVDLGDVIDRVSHAFSRRTPASRPEVKSETYSASLDETGLRLSPHRQREGSAAEAGVDSTRSKSYPLSAWVEGAPHASIEPDPQTEAHLRTVSIRRGRETLYREESVSRHWSLIGNTAQSLLDEPSGLLEHYEARAEGVEVSWIFPQRPAGSGPLEIVAELDGLTYAGRSQQGNHFADADGLARVLVGEAVLVDHLGKTVEVPVDIMAHTLRWEIPAEILEQVTFPVAVDPLIGPEFGMDIRVSAFNQSVTAASNGRDFLVVWQDYRDRNYNIYGTRVTGDGLVLDPQGLAVSTFGAEQRYPSIASDGNDYLVVWEDERRGYSNRDIYGARVTSRGVVVETNGFPISTAAAWQEVPRVAGNSNGYLVVWQDYRSFLSFNVRGQVFATRVTPLGGVLEPNGLAVGDGVPPQDNGGGRDYRVFPDVASDGRDFLVVWRAGGLRAARVSAAGILRDTNASIITPAIVRGAVTSNGTNYLVAWQSSGVKATTVANNGTVATTNGWLVNSSAGGVLLASDGRDYLVAWNDNATYGRRLAGDGTMLDTDRFLIVSRLPGALACNGTNYLLTSGYFEYVPGGDPPLVPHLVANRLTRSGVVLDGPGLELNPLPFDQLNPVVAGNTENYLVVWQEKQRGTGESDIVGTRLSHSGTVLDVAGFTISGAPHAQKSPAIASLGNTYMVVWEDYRNGITASDADIYSARIASSGEVLERDGTVISAAFGAQKNPAVAASPAGYLVAWEDARVGTNSADTRIHGARLTPNGAVVETNGLPISTSDATESNPSVASDGSGYLVVWQDERNAAVTSTDIYGARLTTQGVVSDPNDLAISTALNHQINPAVASSGSGYFVVWEDYRTGPADIFGARVTENGVVVEGNGIIVSAVTNAQTNPAIASNGDDYFVVWQDLRSSTGGPDIYGARISADGALLDTEGLAVMTAVNSKLNPSLGGNGVDFLAVYQRPGVGGATSFRGNVISTNVPVPWMNRDVGTVVSGGGASFSNGSFTFAGGRQLAAPVAFQFVYQTLEGDGEIVARVASVQGEAGLMMCEELSSETRFACMGIDGQGGGVFRRRLMPGGNTYVSDLPRGPAWCKLVRNSNALIGCRSSDGTNWVVAWFTLIDLPARVKVGLAVGPGRAIFDNVSVFAPPPPFGGSSIQTIHFGGEFVPNLPNPWVGDLKVLITGIPGRYAVEFSTDLRTWQTAGEVTNFIGFAIFAETAANGQSNRFYRSRQIAP